MRLYLSSFRIGDHPDRLIELTGANRRTAVVANAVDHLAPADRQRSVAAELTALRELGLDPVELDLRRFAGAPDALRGELAGVGLVWLRGGNAFVLRHRLADSGLDQQLLDGLATDRFVVGGYSAGSCVLGRSLAGLEECDPITDLAQVAPGAPVIMDGLGLLDGTVVPHLASPEHPESTVLTAVAAKLRADGRKIIELRDGDVLFDRGAGPTLLPRSR
ncbi:Type 1 glutamine amidotransferase-like domain-containing protein [Microlunatus speluncae]|uniref:Type 1 glutamine amidotransferase-like domain-containing protein n=1 Tax=Microlunatus speluncae TaxID=2594267 RepID=UPI001375860B|nr:Type 1 glutamine amidotransferase-like domain-containing protein [Microlunatus speluncae]